MKKEKVIGISTFAKIKTGNLMIEEEKKQIRDNNGLHLGFPL